ncbi:MAG: glycosyltransferase [Candidatus Omnitrophica bacterium]|nr:glycosyltransferase [Candidatus Omnitrophota bacterium]
MPPLRVLLLYISDRSGHHQASLAIEQALRAADPSVEVTTLDALAYTNPLLGLIINRAYLGVIRRTPEVWEYLYDNPTVLRRVRRLRKLIHQYNSGKLEALLGELRPQVVACTQAFPCGLVADYKQTNEQTVPLVGILTDYAPHSYWLLDRVDGYVVPSAEAAQRLQASGVDAGRIQTLGIPIDPRFALAGDRDRIRQELRLTDRWPTILIMGGSSGLGPIKELVTALDGIDHPLQLVVIAGGNKRLGTWLRRFQARARQALWVGGRVEEVWRYMELADLLITKPGGLTTAEALAKGLPMIIVNPIPGQESSNTQFLLDHRVAVKAVGWDDATRMVREFIRDPGLLESMRYQALEVGRPDAAAAIAHWLLQLAGQAACAPTSATGQPSVSR